MVTLRNHIADIFDVAISEGDVVYAQQAVRNYTRLAWRSEPTLDGLREILRMLSRGPSNWAMRSAFWACVHSLRR